MWKECKKRNTEGTWGSPPHPARAFFPLPLLSPTMCGGGGFLWKIPAAVSWLDFFACGLVFEYANGKWQFVRLKAQGNAFGL